MSKIADNTEYMNRASRYRLYVTSTQDREFRALCGASRYMYNHLLEKAKRDYKLYEYFSRCVQFPDPVRKPQVNRTSFSKSFAQFRSSEDGKWLRDYSFSIVRASSAHRLAEAYKHFFRRVKNGETPGHPKFKAKGKCRESFVIPEKVKIKGKRLYVPKSGWVKINRKQESKTQGIDSWAYGEARQVTVYYDLGKWYASVVWEVPKTTPASVGTGRVCSIDRNVGNIAIASGKGRCLLIDTQNDKADRHEKQAERYQRKASHRKSFAVKDEDGNIIIKRSGKPLLKASKRKQRLYDRAAKHRAKAAYIRRTQQDKITRLIGDSFETVVIEDLKTKNMTASAKGTLENPGKRVNAKRGLNRSIQRAGWGKLEQMLEYKVCKVLKVDAKYTSQTCHVCGCVARENRPKQSVFKCTACGHSDNADANAARNILQRGIDAAALAEGASVNGQEEENKAGAFLLEKSSGHLDDLSKDFHFLVAGRGEKPAVSVLAVGTVSKP